MKKFFIFAAVASVAFAGCLKNEPTFTNEGAGQAEVKFSAPLMSVATKGAEINGTVFPKDTNFVVFGYYQEGSETYDANGNPELYMDEVKCSYVDGSVDAGDGSGTWKAADGSKYYWPKNGKLTFIAASPAEDDLNSACAYKVTSDKSSLVIEYTAPQDSSLQADILYSDWKADCTSSTEEDDNEAYDGVELAFNHALSIVRINVRAKDPASAAAVKVTGLSINNVYEKGKFTTTYGSTAAWDFTNVTQDYVYTIIEKVSDEVMEGTEPGVAQYEGSEEIEEDFNRFASYIILPQSFATDANITINYSIKHQIMNDDRDGYIEKWLPQTHVYKLNDAGHKVAGENGDPITKWEMGTRYTYDVTIGVDEIYFAPSVAAWKDVNVEYDNETPQYKENDPLYGND